MKRLFRMHPDAVLAGHGRARWYPLFHLIWLFWMIAAPWFAFPDARPRIIALTFASLLVFVPLYFRAWYGDGRRIVWNTVAMAALGLAMVLVNTSWSYVVYAAVLIPYCTTPLRAMLWLGALMAGLAVAAMVAGFGVEIGAFAIGMCVALSLVNLVGRINSLHDAALRLSHDEVRRLAAAAERERIGRDLHDLLGHTLSLIAIKSELARRLFDRDADGARREIVEIERITRDALAQVRAAVTGFRAAGIAAELASARLLLESSGIALTCRSDDLDLSADSESALALCLREAVTNVQRHARATRVTIALTREGRFALLVVDDDGRGGAKRRGNGLTGIDERLAALGGRSAMQSTAGSGTRLELRVPLHAAAATSMSMRRVDELAA